ncbi:glycosyltransferase family 2 protein [Candidatus Woesearchaeota archaeon]|nr:glycosyltransferase family 2 protein [Candidatus Woesearchaeota archaeon]
MELTVVIPAYNEEASIRGTIRNVKKYCQNGQIIVVDDSSTDKTSEIARKEKTRVINHIKNKGYGAALKTGMLAAKTKYVAFLDADMTYDPSYFPQMLDLMKKHELDCVWGNRFAGKQNKMPLIRQFGNRVISLIFWLTTGKNVGDSSSGQRILKTSILKKIDLKTLPDDLDFITALSKRIVSRGLKFKIIPINYYKRAGRSKLALFKHGFRMIRNVLMEK